MAYTGCAAGSRHGVSRRAAPVRRNAGPVAKSSMVATASAQNAPSARRVAGRSSVGTSPACARRRAASAVRPCSSSGEWAMRAAVPRTDTALRTAPSSAGTRSSR